MIVNMNISDYWNKRILLLRFKTIFKLIIKFTSNLESKIQTVV